MSEYIFKLPDLGEGTVEAEIAEWQVKVGDEVNEEDIVGEMMTDKAAVEVSAPVSGRVVRLAGEPGDTVAVGAPLIVFETGADGAAGKDSAARPAAAAPQAPRVAVSDVPRTAGVGAGKIITSPAIRRQAKQAGIDLSQITGSGPRGRIMQEDLDAIAGPGGVAQPAARRERRSGTEEIKVIGVRRMIAERMSASKRNIPHFAYVEEIDVTELESLRVQLNGEKSGADPKFTLLPFIGMAVIRAIDEFPQCNATYDAERNVIVRHAAVHLGIATQTPDGLKVPVIRHAEALGLKALAGEMIRLAAAARENRATREELTGSTITVTSLGKLGGIVSTPIINAPEVSVIGVNKAIERPVVRDGRVTVRLMMNLSSSFDHRFVDGYDAAAMIQQMKNLLEHPATLFVE